MSEFGGAPSAPSEAGADGSTERAGSSKASSGLRARIALAVGALALGLALVFALLLVAIVGLRHRSEQARGSQEVIATANGLQTLVIGFEAGVRGFVLTNQVRSLRPYLVALGRYPRQMALVIHLTADDPDQQGAARAIKRAVDAYLRDYSAPLVEFMVRNPGAARKFAVSMTGTKRVDAIRRLFTNFLAEEQARNEARIERARETAHTAVLIGAISLGVVLMFLLAAALYLERAVASPIRLVARAARRVATVDLSGRVPTEGPGEVGVLEQSFNAMADSLQRNRDDLEERNRRLVEGERLKTELVSNVSHELRTPLASMLGFSDLMLKRDVDPGDRRRYLELIRSESARLAKLLNGLLDLQRQELGVLELVRDEIDLNELLRVQVTLYSAQSELHELTFSPAAEPLLVLADPDRLAQVLGNLLSNAIKYSPEGGDVVVTADSIRGEAWVWVRDSGLGIPREHESQMFTKFFRGDAARKRGIGGTGLGLVLAQQIVEAHGGTIGFDTEPGKGSTFWIRIPAPPAESPSAADHGTKARHRV